MGLSRSIQRISASDFIIIGFLCSISCLFHVAVAAQGPLCLSCKDIPYPRDCDRIIQCLDNEKCFAESFVTGSANQKYNVGCSSAQRCAVKRSSAKRDDITVCNECCDGDYCNRDLCGFTPPPNMTDSVYCLECDDVVHPSQCEHTVLCNPKEICYTEYIKRNGEYRYRMGCISPQNCRASSDIATVKPSSGRKRFLINPDVRIDSYCNKCCVEKLSTSGNCNRKLCNDQEPVPAYIQELVLVNPPVRTDSCVDLTERSCKVLVIEDPTVCDVPGISHYACRKTCKTCVTNIQPTTPPPATDCFYESTKYQGAYENTNKGVPCIDWSSVFQQDSFASMFPDSSVKDAKNRCRDPGGRGHPWCFTSTNNDWDYCPVPFCEQCYYPGKSRQYNGYKNTDIDGNKCESWDSNKGTPISDTNFVDGSKSAAKNYCRNPFPGSPQSSIEQPLCLTQNGFKVCGVKQCTEACQDSPATNCSLVKNYVCQNEYTSITLCPLTCGKCNFGLLAGKVISPPTEFCEDNPAANCPALQAFICSDAEGARTLCPKTCKRCNEINIMPVTTTQQPVSVGSTNQTPVPVATTQPPAPQWLAWGSYTCQISNGICLMTRFRKCSATGCDGKANQVTLCTKEKCPDELNQLNAKTSTTSSTIPSTKPTTQKPTTAVPTTVTTVSSCRDSGKYPDCGVIKDAACEDTDLMYECNKTCNLCGGCNDVLQCQSANQKNTFCTEADLAQKYCRKTCNKCYLPEIPITYDKCGDPVSKEGVCENLQREICLCQDDDIKQLCPNYCGRKCGPIASCSGLGQIMQHDEFENIIGSEAATE